MARPQRGKAGHAMLLRVIWSISWIILMPCILRHAWLGFGLGLGLGLGLGSGLRLGLGLGLEIGLGLGLGLGLGFNAS